MLDLPNGSASRASDIDDRGRVVLGDGRGALTRFDLVRSSAPQGSLRLALGERGMVTSVRLIPGREAALIDDSAGVLYVWDFADAAVTRLGQTEQYVWALDIDAAGRRAYAAGRLDTATALTVVDPQTGARVFESPTRTPAYGVSVTQRGDAALFAVGTQDGSVEVWSEGRYEPLVESHQGEVPIM